MIHERVSKNTFKDMLFVNRLMSYLKGDEDFDKILKKN